MGSRSIRLLCTVLTLASLSLTPYANYCFAKDEEPNDETAQAWCALMVAEYDPDSIPALETPEQRLAAVSERHTLMSFFHAKTGVAYERPLVAMNGAQRSLSVILSKPSHVVADPFAEDGHVTRYDFISGGVAEVGGLRLVGQYEGAEAIVSLMRARAEGDRSGRAVPEIEGVPGAGKSEIIKLLRAGFRNYPLVHPTYFLYTFSWKGLEQIPLLAELLPTKEPLRSPMNETPVALLPEVLQNAFLRAMTAKSKEMIDMEPRPKLELNPQDAYIREQVLAHYLKERAGKPLTPADEVEILNKHIEIIRHLPNEQTLPIVTAQAKDVDYGALFFEKNPIVRLTLGPTHPLASHYNGIIPAANGFAAFLDEFMKNPVPLQQTFLNIFEDGSIAQGGVGTVPVDIFFVAATNRRDREEHIAKNPESPLLDRLNKIPFNYPTAPYEAAKITLYEMQNLWAVPLLDPMDKRVPFVVKDAALDRVIPDVRPGEKLLGPDGRFALWLGNPGQDARVHVSPHALLYLSQVAAVSRMSFDQAKAEEKARFPVIGKPLFRDPMTRLRARMGLVDMTAAQRSELRKLGLLLEEGTFGLSNRKAKEVLQEARMHARKESADRCVTPVIILKAIESRFLKGQLGLSQEMGLQLLIYARAILDNFTVPAYQKDINNALLGPNNSTALAIIYDEIIQEMLALHKEPRATEYRTESGKRNINFARLEGVKKKYAKLTGQPLSPAEIAVFQLEFDARSGDTTKSQRRNEALLQSIAMWQGERVTAGVDASLGTILSIGLGEETGSPDQSGRARLLTTEMQENQGYCPRCTMEALKLVADRVHHSEPGHEHNH